jgi:hypothetical protein
MSVKYYYIIAMILSGGVLSVFSYRYHWSLKVWSKINKKMKTSLNLPVWFFSAILIQYAILVLLKTISMQEGVIYILLGTVAGIMIMLMPNTNCAVRK